MRRLPSILTSGAAAVVLLTSAMALAQQGVVEGDASAVATVKARDQAAARARQQSRRGMANQLRPFYRYALMHARTACGLTKEQSQKIRPEADTAYEQAIAGLYAAIVEARRSPGGGEPDYHEAIQEAVSSVVVRHVSRERWAALQADLRRRAASRKEAGIPLLVAVLDRKLHLTRRQRQQIAESLSAHWDDRWCDALESAFTLGSRWPDVPDQLVAPYLSAAQQETWRQVPRIRGRLWGVVVDHGGDPAMEQELGAVGSMRPPAPRPAIGGTLPVAPVGRQPMPARPQAVARDLVVRRLDIALPAGPDIGQVVRQPAGAIRPAAPQDGDNDPDEEDGPAERLQRQHLERQKVLEQHYLSNFDRQVLLAAGEESARLQFESALAKRVDDLGRAGGLTDPQRKKLRAAGRGDIKRFFDRFVEAREKLREGFGRGRVSMGDVQTLRAERDALLTVEGPIFSGVLPRTLTDDQRAALEDDASERLAFRYRADIRWTAVLLARSLGLIDDQRRRLESSLLERAIPPKKFDAHDYVDYAIVMYQASRIAEEDMRPIFDDLQWRVLTQEFAAARQWELYLRRGGFFEMRFDDTRDAPLPPIHLLAPPQIRSR